MKIDAPEFYAHDRAEWRQWLAENHDSAVNVWLVYDKKSAGGILSYEDIVQEALCFGWIDSVGAKVDEQRTKLYVSRRKPKSVWSKINKAHIDKLLASGSMMPAGLQAIETAKANGSWAAIDDVEAMVMPEDLVQALAANPRAQAHFDAFPPGSRKVILQWIASAKQTDTRAKRVSETVRLAEQNVRANHYHQPKSATSS